MEGTIEVGYHARVKRFADMRDGDEIVTVEVRKDELEYAAFCVSQFHHLNVLRSHKLTQDSGC